MGTQILIKHRQWKTLQDSMIAEIEEAGGVVVMVDRAPARTAAGRYIVNIPDLADLPVVRYAAERAGCRVWEWGEDDTEQETGGAETSPETGEIAATGGARGGAGTNALDDALRLLDADNFNVRLLPVVANRYERALNRRFATPWAERKAKALGVTIGAFPWAETLLSIRNCDPRDSDDELVILFGRTLADRMRQALADHLDWLTDHGHEWPEGARRGEIDPLADYERRDGRHEEIETAEPAAQEHEHNSARALERLRVWFGARDILGATVEELAHFTATPTAIWGDGIRQLERDGFRFVRQPGGLVVKDRPEGGDDDGS